jgi:3-isopropylmalate/(R)-2-methylmalate dehydratase small subunit
MSMEGTAFKYGDNVDTDVIIPARYLNSSDPAHLAKHCMEDIDASFAKSVRSGDIVVALANFGCGSSREHAPLALKTAGVSCVIASSFARIFFRNAVNIGLPLLECPEAAAAASKGDRLSVDLATGSIRNLTRGLEHQAVGLPDFIRDIVAAGGLIEYTKARRPATAAERGIPWMKRGALCDTL